MESLLNLIGILIDKQHLITTWSHTCGLSKNASSANSSNIEKHNSFKTFVYIQLVPNDVIEKCFEHNTNSLCYQKKDNFLKHIYVI